MNLHEILLQRLQRVPELEHRQQPGWLRIEAIQPNGFAVEVHTGESNWTVYLGNGGFHETFASGTEVINFVAWCYSGEARLREFWRGSIPQKCVLEGLHDGDWREISATGYFLVPFWQKSREVVLQNPCLLE
ncbi:hypothetical protein [Candidatus Phycosocius bacilliformis]|uniref:hypothetical protein n=1 Tax=Candidatus Phycosocius bacilliformis TaxID=1445552 RepID=UPI000D599B3D|nr:hypothetical protein [Candidatus Phycosocius bacilliformis]